MKTATKFKEKKDRLANQMNTQQQDQMFEYDDLDGGMDMLDDGMGAGADIESKLQLEH